MGWEQGIVGLHDDRRNSKENWWIIDWQQYCHNKSINTQLTWAKEKYWTRVYTTFHIRHWFSLVVAFRNHCQCHRQSIGTIWNLVDTHNSPLPFWPALMSCKSFHTLSCCSHEQNYLLHPPCLLSAYMDQTATCSNLFVSHQSVWARGQREWHAARIWKHLSCDNSSN